MVCGLEELTKEELISWIRSNVPNLDEDQVVMDSLWAQSELAWEKYKVASKRGEEANEKIIQLVQVYADGPIKPGVKLRRWPSEAKQEYARLDKERRDSFKDSKEWFSRHSDVVKRMLAIQNAKSDWLCPRHEPAASAEGNH